MTIPSDDAVFHAIAGLVAEGEYLDELPAEGSLPVPPYPVATEAAVHEAEASIGHPLPALLRRLYLEVANGGFGPGYGLLGVAGGHALAPEGNAIERHRQRTEWRPETPAHLFPICDWGCAITSFVDCSDPQATIWGLDPNAVEDIDDALFRQEFGLTEWLQLWVDTDLYQPWVLEDPVTGQWRGATNAETARMMAEYDDPDDGSSG